MIPRLRYFFPAALLAVVSATADASLFVHFDGTFDPTRVNIAGSIASFTVTLELSNGNDSLLNNAWDSTHLVRASLVSGAYVATFDSAPNLRIATDASGQLIGAAIPRLVGSTGSDSFGGTDVPQLNLGTSVGFVFDSTHQNNALTLDSIRAMRRESDLTGFRIEPNSTVPEPASVLVWSLLGLVGGVGSWKRCHRSRRGRRGIVAASDPTTR